PGKNRLESPLQLGSIPIDDSHMRRRARALLSYPAMLLVAGAALSLSPAPARAATIAESTTGITISVAGDGTYTIQFADPAWTFSGTVSGGVKNIHADTGSDQAGAFEEIVFDERAKPARHLGIRTWAGRPGVLFTQAMTASCPNANAFPRFST